MYYAVHNHKQQLGKLDRHIIKYITVQNKLLNYFEQLFLYNILSIFRSEFYSGTERISNPFQP